MSDKIISKSRNISLVDKDAPNVDNSGVSRPIASWITSKRLTNAKAGDTCSRGNVQSFTTFSASGPPAIARRDLSASDDGKMFNHRRESLQQRHARQSSVARRDQNEEFESASQRYENAILRYQKPRLQSKRQISREHQRQQNNNSSSDESVARNKSKSTSSIDAQSVNNILDEFEDLDYCRSSDLSDVGNINVNNFEAIIMDQQKRQQQERSRLSKAKVQIKSIPTKEKIHPVLKVNQQTQVRQRSRDRQKDSSKAHQQDNCCASSPTRTTAMDVIESGRSKMPEILLRKGEVQKRVDEWLNQAHSQNFPLSPREKPLTRSNSSAEQKSQRRYRVQDRSRSIDEAKGRLNGGASSSYDDLTRMDRKLERGRPDRVNVGVNTSRGTYKEYLATKNKVKQQDYGAQSSVALSRSGDSSPASKIPQREPFGSSFRSKRAEMNSEEKKSADGRIAYLVKTRGESNYGRITVNSSKMTEVSTVTATTTTSIISCRKPSLKRSGNGADQNCAVARSLVKEETDPRSPRGTGFSKGPPSAGNLVDQGELISPNKDGESRRPAAAASEPTPRLAVAAADKTIEETCKSTEVPTSCAIDHPRDNRPRIASMESGIAIEPRRRFQISNDVRREARSIDQSRQEQPIYGLTVGAYVRAFQSQAESRSGPRIRCHKVEATSMEIRKPPVFSRRDLGVSSSRDVGAQDRTKASIDVSSSSFKPNNRAYIATNDPQKLNEQNATGSKVAICEAVSSCKITRYTSPDHVERIYERSLQPQVIHADDLESILRPSLQVSPYGERIDASRSDRDSPVKETSSSAVEDEPFEKFNESRHEHLETIEEDERKSEDSFCKYPEIGLKQCLKVQQSLPNGRARDSVDKRKDNPSIPAKEQQHLIAFNEPARTFMTFQTTLPCQSNVKSSAQSRSSEMKESKEEIRQNSDETTMILQDLVTDYQNASREDQDRLTIHSRENSNLSTATIPIDELESQRSSKSKTEGDSSRTNKLQFGEKSQDRVEKTTKNVEERGGAVINEVLVKNLRFEQDVPEIPIETKVDYSVQQVNFRNILCDDYYENEKNRKIYMTKEEMDHQKLIDMLKKGDLEALKMVSDKNDFYARLAIYVSLMFLSKC